MSGFLELNYKLNEDSQNKLNFKNLYGASSALSIMDLANSSHKSLVIVAQNMTEAITLEDDLKHLAKFSNTIVELFPDWETLPYDTFSPYQDIISRRLEILATLSTQKCILIITASTLMGKVAPTNYINSSSLILKKNTQVDINNFKHKLIDAGYLLTKQVFEHGEFAIRGEIIDLFPMGSKFPYRLDFFDDEIESISYFDLESQRSIEKVDEIRLLPAHEFPTNEEAIDLFRKHYREVFNPSDITKHTIYQQISKRNIPAGIEYYLPLFFNSTATIFDYLSEKTIFVLLNNLEPIAKSFFEDVTARANKFTSNPDHPSLPPKDLFLTPNELLEHISKYDIIKLFTNTETAPRGAISADTKALPPIAINSSNEKPTQEFVDFISSFKGQVIISTSSLGRVEIIKELLMKDCQITSVDSLKDFYKLLENSNNNTSTTKKSKKDTSDNISKEIFITVAPFIKGFIVGNKYALITENDLLGYAYTRSNKRSKNKVINPEAIIKNLVELKPGEPIVHEQYGIAKFLGLEVLEIEGIKAEFVSLEFAQEAKMFIPITSLQLLSRYTGQSDVALTKLGTDAWKKAKNKAAQKIRDIAANLLDINAKRALKCGYKYTLDKQEYNLFANGFGYQPTEDQQKAIDAVLMDMQSIKPMDRLVCGDVGFGKTEVAMRAAFVAASNGKQVAILVPTTLLAEQHYDSFRERFANTPITIASISRFKSTKEQNEALRELKDGKIDIIIGTHKLLSKSIQFKDLGLLIVDEEHRFGVTQKEKIKSLRAEVDILTMTATPIPRTLNMAMNGVRDLSIIATPPAKRLAIKTFVHEYDDTIIREAVLRELKRGGQTYFLHNDVDSINKVAAELAELLPEAKIAVAHAQLPEKELASIMRDFYHQRFNVLVCSTIIETGIDVPTANTIIMNRADKLGLAQMHQLRGRVGRSHHQAYAYLLTIPQSALSADAKKRLQAISALEELGSGFILATQDLEIRGAGEILGSEQSGQIEGIGFNLYMDMLDEAIEALKNGQEFNPDIVNKTDISIELGIPVIFPQNYIFDVNTRLSLYKRLSSALCNEDIADLKAEIVDRFGRLPKEATYLFKVAELKLLCKKLGIKDITLNNKYGSIEFGNEIHVEFAYLTSLITQQSNMFKLEGSSKIKINKSSDSHDGKLNMIVNILTDMNNHYEA